MTGASVRFELGAWAGTERGRQGQRLVAHWLAHQGHDDPQKFFDYSLSQLPDPYSLYRLQEAAELLVGALSSGQKVMVVGDYDVDGVTSTALLVRFFRACGFAVDWLIPNRFSEGYGLNALVVKRILAESPDWVVTVDNGITAKEQVRQLEAAGVKVVVTDHHLPVQGKVPECLVINPKLPENQGYAARDLSGAGVAFMLLLALRKELRGQGFWTGKKEPNLLESLDLVALGNVADQVPLVGVNRVLTHHGLEQMRRRLDEPANLPGPASYLKTFQQDQKFSFINAETLGFRLGPLINAAGRMADAGLAVEFLLEPQLEASAESLKGLQRFNQQRKKKQATMVSRAAGLVSEPNPQGLVLVDSSFHEGLVGVVASKLSEQYQCPTLVGTLSDQGTIKCSGRSKSGDLTQILGQLDDLLLGYGGHAAAAGCQFRPEDLDEVQRRFCEASASVTEGAKAAVLGDYEVTKEMLTLEFSHQLKQLEPFGRGNEKPVFWIKSLSLGQPRTMGEFHLKWEVAPGLDFIRWDGAKEGMEPGEYQVAFVLSENHFRGRVSLQAVIGHHTRLG